MSQPRTPGSEGAPDITPIRRLVRTTLHLLRSSWVATGAGLTVGLGVGALVLLALLDLATPFYSAIRVAALVLVVVPTLWAFLVGVLLPLFRRLRPVQVARRIERNIPGIHNRLVSCLDLDSPSPRQGRVSPEFHRRLVGEALERIRGFHPRSVVDGRSLRRALLFATASILAFAGAFGLLSDRFPTALARIFSPLADIPPASGVLYTVEPGDAKRLKGDDITFTAKVTKGDPERLQLELVPDDAPGKPIRHDLQKNEPGVWTLTLGGLESSFHYRVVGGGTWTRRNRITMVERPTLTGLHTVLHYPDYMRIPAPRVGPPQTADVTGPQGSSVEVVTQVQGDVSGGEIQLLETRSRSVEIVERPERIWFQERVPTGAGQDGRWDWDFKLLARPVHTEPSQDGLHSHRFHNAAAAFPVRRGDNLFVMVYIPKNHKPKALMLQWNDGSDWEHRAYWGADKFTQGKPDTPTRRKMGALPPAGEWVRLEVPAAQVDLEGKSLRGMEFTLFDGQAYWHRAGTVPATHLETPELYVARTFPMESSGSGQWSGRFPLERNALYRVELRNELGHPSKPMKPGRATAVVDNPPQVVLERPASDLVLNEPIQVPLSISAYDDFGLDDIVISVQKGDSGGFTGRPAKTYKEPTRSESFTTSLDLRPLELKPGEHIKYRVEARDRKGQIAQTREYMIRIAADGSAADRQLTEFDKQQDSFRENLVKLIAEQAKVQETIKAMAAKYAPLEEKIETARAEARAQERSAPHGDPKTTEPAKANEPAKPPKLDPEAAKQLEALRRELAEAAGREEQNTNLGKQVDEGLRQAVDRAKNLAILPPEMLHQLEQAREMFEDRALDPLQELAGELRQGAAPDKPTPALGELEHQADRVQKELEAVKARLDAEANARKELANDAAHALDELRAEMLRQNADLTARDLKDLMNFLKEHAEELKRLEGQQEDLGQATPPAPEMLLPDIEKRQDALEAREDRALDQARELLDAERLRRLRERPEFPEAPFAPDADEERVPPKEEDPDDPAEAKKKADAAKADEAAMENHQDEDQEELFMPALGGPKPKLDPRFADKLRPLPPRDGDQGKAEPDAVRQQRQELLDRQRHRLGELETARQSLQSDEHSLDALLQALQNALKAGSPEAAQHLLDQLMNDPKMQAAMAMLERRNELSPSRDQSKGQPHTASRPSRGGDRHQHRPTTDKLGSGLDAELAKLDPDTRTVILKMQPRLREELLQGLREEGPEAYRGFIRDYFRKLTQVKGNP